MTTKRARPRTLALADHIGHRGARPVGAYNPKSVLESFGSHIHLVDADSAAHLDVVLATDHVEPVMNGEDVCPALPAPKCTENAGRMARKKVKK